MIKTLLDSGIRLESVRDVFSYLREHVDDRHQLGQHRHPRARPWCCATNDELIDIVRSGQGVLNVLPLAGVKDDVDAKLDPRRTPARTRRSAARPRLRPPPVAHV